MHQFIATRSTSFAGRRYLNRQILLRHLRLALNRTSRLCRRRTAAAVPSRVRSTSSAPASSTAATGARPRSIRFCTSTSATTTSFRIQQWHRAWHRPLRAGRGRRAQANARLSPDDDLQCSITSSTRLARGPSAQRVPRPRARRHAAWVVSGEEEGAGRGRRSWRARWGSEGEIRNHRDDFRLGLTRWVARTSGRRRRLSLVRRRGHLARSRRTAKGMLASCGIGARMVLSGRRTAAAHLWRRLRAAGLAHDGSRSSSPPQGKSPPPACEEFGPRRETHRKRRPFVQHFASIFAETTLPALRECLPFSQCSCRFSIDGCGLSSRERSTAATFVAASASSSVP